MKPSFSAVAVFPSVALAANQVLLGPVFEAPSNVSKEASIQKAVKGFGDCLNNVLQTGKTPFGADINGNDTAVSVTVLQGADSQPLLDYHHTPINLNVSTGSVANVSSSCMYRIGSVSKLLTMYAILVNNGSQIYNSPVTDFVPELKDIASNHTSFTDAVQWDEVTVGALASHLSGLGRDYNNGDLSYLDIPPAAVGLPVLPPDEVPTCGVGESQEPCPRNEFFYGITLRHPVFLPYTTPIYSNAAYRILGYVLENITSTSFHEAYNDTVFQPLGMANTQTFVPEKPRVGVIAPGLSGWDFDMGDEVPTGGIYSSSGDLAKLGQAILSNKQLPSVETRHWMKPHTHTSSMSFSVGAPWEIWRTRSKITTRRVIDLYTKSGSIGQYSSVLILVPDQDLVVSVLAAGADSASLKNTASELAVQKLLPVMENVARTQACEKFCGLYKAANSSLNSTLELDVDGDTGLRVKSWINRGVDFFTVAQEYADSTKGGKVTSMRLYPSNIRNETLASYRAIIATQPYGNDTEVPRIFDDAASQWGKIDQLMYGNIAVDDFIFYLNEEGVAQSVEARVMRAGALIKV